MKKLLSLLGASFFVSSTGVTSVISCNSPSHESGDDVVKNDISKINIEAPNSTITVADLITNIENALSIDKAVIDVDFTINYYTNNSKDPVEINDSDLTKTLKELEITKISVISTEKSQLITGQIDITVKYSDDNNKIVISNIVISDADSTKSIKDINDEILKKIQSLDPSVTLYDFTINYYTNNSSNPVTINDSDLEKTLDDFTITKISVISNDNSVHISGNFNIKITYKKISIENLKVTIDYKVTVKKAVELINTNIKNISGISKNIKQDIDYKISFLDKDKKTVDEQSDSSDVLSTKEIYFVKITSLDSSIRLKGESNISVSYPEKKSLSDLSVTASYEDKITDVFENIQNAIKNMASDALDNTDYVVNYYDINGEMIPNPITTKSFNDSKIYSIKVTAKSESILLQGEADIKVSYPDIVSISQFKDQQISGDKTIQDFLIQVGKKIEGINPNIAPQVDYSYQFLDSQGNTINFDAKPDTVISSIDGISKIRVIAIEGSLYIKDYFDVTVVIENGN